MSHPRAATHRTGPGARLAALLATSSLLAVVILLAPTPRGGTQNGPPSTAYAQQLVPVERQSAGRFTAIDVFVDPSEAPLAAYQVELRDVARAARLVGIEGGDHPAFRAPPFYDPAALQGDRVILAAFSTSPSLPRGLTRVATLHVWLPADGHAEWRIELQVAAAIDGSRIPATVAWKGDES